MSLKNFHILFIFASLILFSGFAAWSFKFYQIQNDAFYLSTGVFSSVIAVALVVYGKSILEKFKALKLYES